MDGTTTEIEVFEEADGRLAARIAGVRDAEGKPMHPQCAACRDAPGRSIEGYRFVFGLSRSGDRWTGGKVVDLRQGLLQGYLADCELWVDRGELVLYGYARFLGVKLGQETRWKGVAR